MPREGVEIATDLRVDTLLLALPVEVAEPDLHHRQGGDHPLVDGGHPVVSGVVPVHAEQLAGHPLGAIHLQGLDELVGRDAVLAAFAGAEKDLARGGVEVTDVDENRVFHREGRGAEVRDSHRCLPRPRLWRRHTPAAAAAGGLASSETTRP